ncbi:hypothetical protein LTR53_003293 [Teratosphaeriaceae sp. CCFEE 6253]|nr:hypothetical protein LTR53_003293 [Teratosphaeriaceae sp. CCFEE 6253]
MNGLRESPRPQLDALDPRLLTPTVWRELFEIFQMLYSADLPFVHPPTFLKPLRQTPMQPPSTEPSNVPCRPPASPEFLLAFLALTARFHPKLVAHHSPPTSTRPSNPLIASEYYAAAANERLVTSWMDNRVHDIERTQAMLMLGLHEWGMCRGAKAWLTVGMAIRAAQAIGLQYERDLDDEPMSRAQALDCEAERMGLDLSPKNATGETMSEEEAFIQQEVRRRTFWSCYIMDRYLSSGKYRPQMLHAHELRIQLPASERSFLFAEKVRTLMLGEENRAVAGRAEVQNHRHASVMLGTSETPERSTTWSPRDQKDNDEESGRLEVGADEGLVSRYIKILEIYGRVVQWSCAGGRRTEKLPPWDARCEWHKLRQQCLEFKASLPRQHQLTPQNTQAHISLKTSTPYTLVHTVYLLCQIMLHREYVPFLPIRCSKPEGPLDAPTFPPDRFDVPPNFWGESARELFRAAREIMDLVRSCQEWNALVETPIVGFAIYTVAFIGVYCHNFPWMDPDGSMCTQPQPGAAVKPSNAGGSKGFEAARKAVEMIGQMRPRLRMANGWFMTVTRMYTYFRKMKSDYRKNTNSMETSSSENDSSSNRPLSLREGGLGGGLEEWKILERTIRDFGNLEDQDVEMTDAGARPGSRATDPLFEDSSAAPTVKSEDRDARAASLEHPRAEGGPWNAINAAPGAAVSRQPSVSTPSSAQFRTYDSYPSQYRTVQQPIQQQPQQQQLPPLQGQQPLPSYSNHLGSFPPAYAADGSMLPGGAPSLTSPASLSASTPSQASPPFDRPQQSGYGGWTPQNNAYAMQPPHAPYSNGPHHGHQPTPMPVQAYPTPHATHTSQQQPHMPLVPMQAREPPPVQQAWDAFQKEAWLNSLQTRMSGDDLAAFVDGGDLADWVSHTNGSTPGWLNTIWAAPSG